jgi:hypothetical protein
VEFTDEQFGLPAADPPRLRNPSHAPVMYRFAKVTPPTVTIAHTTLPALSVAQPGPRRPSGNACERLFYCCPLARPVSRDFPPGSTGLPALGLRKIAGEFH